MQPLRYMPRPPTRRRIALITPHLGPGGAERVLLDVAAALEPEAFELLLLATHSRDDRWAARWRATAERVIDLAALVPPDRMSAAVYSIVTNWRCEAVLVQKQPFRLRGPFPHPQSRGRHSDSGLGHATSDDWDQIAATAGVRGAIDVRIAISDDVRRRLVRTGVPGGPRPAGKERCGPATVSPNPRPRNAATGTVLFAGRLDTVKRPLLLVDIAERLAALRAASRLPDRDRRRRPQLPALKAKARHRRIEDLFEFLGFVDDITPLFAESDMLILPSARGRNPLVILEAMASGRPVVASKVGAISEAADPGCGILVETGEGEVQRFAAALNRLLNESHLREAMGNAGRRKAEMEFDSASARAAYRRLFE